MTTSSIYALIHKLEKDGGCGGRRGGTNRLVAGMVRNFERLGGELRLHDPVVHIATTGQPRHRGRNPERLDRQVRRHPQQRRPGPPPIATCCAAASAARPWPGGSRRSASAPRCSWFTSGSRATGRASRTTPILFGPRYKGCSDDIYERGVLPADFSIYLHHPTVTDPSMAPEGKSTFYALVPVAHMGKLRSTGSRSGRCSSSACSPKSSGG
jgi:phytoene desaturase